MVPSQWGRSLVSTAWGGVLTGALIGVLVVLRGTEGHVSTEDAVLVAGVGVLWGGMIGAVVGVVLGMPLVVAAAVVRQQSDAWRTVGTVAAAAIGSVAAMMVVGGPPSQGIAIVAAGVLCPAWRAWRGLGWIFEVSEGPVEAARQGQLS